jgi:hypothetical protein
MTWFLFGRLCGRTNLVSAHPAAPRWAAQACGGLRKASGKPRSAAIGDCPTGAMPDDTGEFMLGDVRVNVVFLESIRR